VHAHLEKQGMLADYVDNRFMEVRCVHPLVALFEKLDAMARRYNRGLACPSSSTTAGSTQRRTPGCRDLDRH